MKRYAAFDPPEYLAWAPEPKLIDEFSHTLSLDVKREAVIEGLTEENFLSLWGAFEHLTPGVTSCRP